MFTAKAIMDNYTVTGKGDTEEKAIIEFARSLHAQWFGCPLGTTAFHDYETPEEFLSCCRLGYASHGDFRPTAAMMWDGLRTLVGMIEVTNDN